MISGYSLFFSLLPILLLTACASPQQKAVSAFCNTEGFKQMPPNNRMERQIQSVHVGDKLVGSREVCTVQNNQSRDKRGNVTTVRERVCIDEPITQPVYEPREVNIVTDLNLFSRQNFVQSCIADSLAKGMYSHLK